jgi:hypothetical protein
MPAKRECCTAALHSKLLLTRSSPDGHHTSSSFLLLPVANEMVEGTPLAAILTSRALHLVPAAAAILL